MQVCALKYARSVQIKDRRWLVKEFSSLLQKIVFNSQVFFFFATVFFVTQQSCVTNPP